MNVWIVNHYAIPPAYGGLNRHYYFSKNFKALGHTTRIISSGKIHNSEYNFSTKELFQVMESDGVEYTFVKASDYKGNGLGRIFSFLEFPIRAFKTMKKLYKTEKPDVIYASSPELFSTAVALLFGRKRNIPVIVEIRDLWPESVVEYTSLTARNPIIKILYRLERWIYSKADRLIYTFEGGKDYVVKKGWDTGNGGPVDISKIGYVNNGVDLAAFKKDVENHIVEDSVLDSNLFKVVYTGSVRRVNSIWLLVETARVLKENHIDDVAIVIYGDGTERAGLEQLSKDYGLENIFFRNRIDKKYVPSILSRSSLNIFVGEDDAMNQYGLSLNKLFDYMAAGKPILTNMESGYDNLLKYSCGKVVANNDVEAIVEGIKYFKNLDDSQYQKYCENSIMASRDFDYVNLAKKLGDIFEELKGEKL